MKTHLSSTTGSALTRRGFTLIEMTTVIIVGLMIAVMSLTLFNHQLTTYQIINTQNFLIHEAPQVNNTLNRIVSRANFFRLYPTLTDAESGSNSTITNASVLALQFSGTADQPDSFGVIAFDSEANELNYYHLESMAQLAVVEEPAWRISGQVNGASFYVENGVLRIKLTGPNGAEIIYSTTTLR
ncbi:hypothetical protein NT6N_35530 [Oceaniferula spumae]|uniref:Prepilin-type N-terminal cleavage/methylation domain-containing protein n=1 Tax=Oceaniferula spumae TaxID=2979115 RepID=A0AAT9FRB0_9BACT